MTAPFPYPIGGGEVVLDYDFPSGDLSGDGWVKSGDDVVIGWWQDAHGFPYIAGQVLFQWVPNVPPSHRSTFWTVMLSDLPGGALLTPGQRVTIAGRAEWRLGTGFDGGAWVGMEANGARGTLSHPIWGGGVRTFSFDTVADEDGDVELKIGVDRMNASLNVDYNWRGFTVTTAGYDPDPLSDIIFDSALLTENGLPVSITRGGAAFDPQEVWEDYDFPGKTAPVAGLDELMSQRPVIRATCMLTGERPVEQYSPGGTWGAHASVGGARTYSTAPMRAALGAAFYLTDVVCLWKRQRGDSIAVHFPKALCRRYGVHSRDKDEGEIQIEIEARQDLVTEASEGTTVGNPNTTRLYQIHILPPTYTLEEGI